jgi:hypothetical protein
MSDLAATPSNLLSDYVDQKDFCAEIRISIRTDNRWNELGKGPVRTVVGRRVLYSRENIRRWLADREKKRPQRRPRNITVARKRKSARAAA